LKDNRWLRIFASVGFLEFVVFLLLFVVLRKAEFLWDVSVFFGAKL
jgi:hypothetical protein